MKILITGGDGQLGSDCLKVLHRKYDVLAVDLKELDITNPDAVEETVRHFTPDVLINCAAYTRVDDCETERELAWKVNVDGPRNLSLSVGKTGGKLIHISTDYIFNGKKPHNEPYEENDATEPLSYYGRTKLESELVIQKLIDSHIIIRTAWVFGVNGHNFLKTMLKLALNNPGKEIKVVNDQYGSPTWSYRLAQQIDKLIEIDGQGTYHATSEGYCTWYELAVYFLEKMGVEHHIDPCSTNEYPTPAVRPKNSILENKRLKQEGINLMPRWQDGIDQFVKNFKWTLINEKKGAKQ